jgi:hypothetical protein
MLKVALGHIRERELAHLSKSNKGPDPINSFSSRIVRCRTQVKLVLSTELPSLLPLTDSFKVKVNITLVLRRPFKVGFARCRSLYSDTYTSPTESTQYNIFSSRSSGRYKRGYGRRLL